MGMRRTKQNTGEGGWVSDWVKEIQTERVSSIQAQSHTASATIGHPQQRTWKQKENSEKKQTLIDNYIYNVYIFRPVSHAVSCFSPMYTVFGVVRVAGRWTTQPLLHSCPERTTCHVYTYITSVFVTYASERTACTDTHTHERTHAVTSSWFYVHKQKQKENWMTRSRHGTHAMLEGEIVFRSLFLFSVSFFFLRYILYTNAFFASSISALECCESMEQRNTRIKHDVGLECEHSEQCESDRVSIVFRDLISNKRAFGMSQSKQKKQVKIKRTRNERSVNDKKFSHGHLNKKKSCRKEECAPVQHITERSIYITLKLLTPIKV